MSIVKTGTCSKSLPSSWSIMDIKRTIVTNCDLGSQARVEENHSLSRLENCDVNTMFLAFPAFYLRDQVSSTEISRTTQLPVFTCSPKADKQPERKGWRAA